MITIKISNIFNSKKVQHGYQLNVDSNFHGAIKTNDAEILKQLEIIDLTIEDLETIKGLQPLIKENLEGLVDTFYKTILKADNLKAIIDQNSSTNRLRQTLEKHILEMFNGIIDYEFIEKRITVAKVHIRIGLEPKWYLGAFQNLFSSLSKVINTNISDQVKKAEIMDVISKLLNFEQQLVLEAYEKNKTYPNVNRNMKKLEVI
ncbi:protoglobin domain-containing protein [Anaerobacillus isosaccharinicus]|uniref:Protoglobin domain-containing protein n=1 Tax=Anaerobacillus isosaccharinicus TaxID=1532552 RepID=A0A7S7L8G9_9BACI|nr:protoglobin domain-containing protein [Anaerobacillus isosaccharinicus]MBA5585282.1 hypothetical protein [Anaerobacillus isosaccharinicus]QOY36389.1 hypothetical protein AWH56_001445 [Anaerobacillus isosaccharinicus]